MSNNADKYNQSFRKRKENEIIVELDKEVMYTNRCKDSKQERREYHDYSTWRNQ